MEATKSRRDLYAEVTQRIVTALAQGVRPWTASGGHVGRPMRHTGEPYRGINVLLLWSTAQERGYERNTWLTYR